MMLIRLTYFSRNHLDRWYRTIDRGIAEIVATSTASNLRDGITGALIYDRNWFAQVLEGSQSEVSATFERILRDQRHGDVSLVTMQPIARRCYPGSAMVAVPRGEDNHDLFRHHCEGEGFDPRQMRADRLSDLIQAVVQGSSQGDAHGRQGDIRPRFADAEEGPG